MKILPGFDVATIENPVVLAAAFLISEAPLPISVPRIETKARELGLRDSFATTLARTAVHDEDVHELLLEIVLHRSDDTLAGAVLLVRDNPDISSNDIVKAR